MDTPPTRSQPLAIGALTGYGIAAIPVQFMSVLVVLMYMKYALDDLGASASVVGLIFLLAKLWDAVSDPAVGHLSDRTQARFGRRRGWMFASVPLLAGFGVMLWAPPDGLSGFWLEAWIAVSVVGFYTAYTCFEVPHMALGAEITLDRQERNRIFGVRQITRTLGMLVAATGGVYLVQQGVHAATWMAIGVGIASVVLIVGGISLLPPESPEFMGRGGDNPFRAVRDVAANPHARLLLFVFFIESVGSGGIGALTPFVVQYVMKMPEILPFMLGVYMISALIAVPFWVWLGNFFEKRHLWLYAMVQGGVGYSLIFWVDEGSWLLMAISSLLAGTAGACGNTLGQALKAEVIDFDEYLTNERKEGAYFAGWSFMSKLASGIMIGLVGISLDWAGYVENAADQTERVKQTMLFLMGGVPMIGYGIGSLAFTRFRLSEAEHTRIRAELEERNRGR